MKTNIRSIDEALSVLDEAASDSAEQIKKLMISDYRRLRKAVTDMTPELAEVISKTKDNVVDISEKTARKVDESAHERPWAYVGGAAATALVVGVWLGRKISS